MLFAVLATTATAAPSPQVCDGQVVIESPDPARRFEFSAASRDGSIVVGSYIPDFGMPPVPLVWTDTTGSVPLPIGTADGAMATGISDDGSVIVGYLTLSSGEQRAVRWDQQSGPVELIPTGLPTQSGEAQGVSGNGATIFGRRFEGGISIPFLWTSGGGYDETLPPGYTGGVYLDASRDGQSVLGRLNAVASGGVLTPVVLQPGGVVTELEPLSPAFPTITEIGDLSADGRIVVGSARAASGVRVPTRWTDGVPESFETQFPRPPFTSGELFQVLQGPEVYFGTTGVNGTEWPAFYAETTGLQAIGRPWVGEPRWFLASEDGSSYFFGDSGAVLRRRESEFGLRYCGDAVPNSSGCVSRLDATGSDLVADNQLTLAASGLPTSVFGFFLVAPTTGLVFQPPGSRGVLCLGGSIGRFVGPGQIQSSGVNGTIRLDVDLQALPQPTGSTAALPGETWMFQAWHRDQFATATSNFSTALAVTLR